MMFYFVIGFCAVLLTISLMDYIAARRRLVDRKLQEIVDRKLTARQDAQTIEILNLREACGVMRNLLIDIAENEAALDAITEKTPADAQAQIVADRDMRRRELRAELDAVIRSSEPAPLIHAQL